jgi:hypothetical protein
MRKIEENMIKAIRTLRDNGANASWSSGNTVVTNHEMRGAGNATEIFLHGHHIATISENDSIVMNLCGWNTNTTRSRLSAIIKTFGRSNGQGLGISTCKGQAFRHDNDGKHAVPSDGWFNITL